MGTPSTATSMQGIFERVKHRSYDVEGSLLVVACGCCGVVDYELINGKYGPMKIQSFQPYNINDNSIIS